MHGSTFPRAPCSHHGVLPYPTSGRLGATSSARHSGPVLTCHHPDTAGFFEDIGVRRGALRTPPPPAGHLRLRGIHKEDVTHDEHRTAALPGRPVLHAVPAGVAFRSTRHLAAGSPQFIQQSIGNENILHHRRARWIRDLGAVGKMQRLRRAGELRPKKAALLSPRLRLVQEDGTPDGPFLRLLVWHSHAALQDPAPDHVGFLHLPRRLLRPPGATTRNQPTTDQSGQQACFHASSLPTGTQPQPPATAWGKETGAAKDVMQRSCDKAPASSRWNV